MKKRIPWKEQLRIHPELRDIERWPKPDLSQQSEQTRARFSTLLTAISAVLRGLSVQAVATSNGIGKAEFYRILDRALGSAEGEYPRLSEALICGCRLKSYRRKKPVKSTNRYGFVGAFTRLFEDHPGVFSTLWEAVAQEGKAKGQWFTSKSFRDHALGVLELDGVERTQYPFNIKSQALSSFRRLLLALRIEVAQAKSDQSVLVIAEWDALLDSYIAYDEIQTDEWREDVSTSLNIAFDDGQTETFRLPRMWLGLAIARADSCIEGYAHSFTSQPSQDDVLALFSSMCSRWEPCTDLYPGLAYPDGAGLPSGLIPGCAYAAPNSISWDNGWSHYGTRPIEFALKAWLCEIHFGLPAYPVARILLEQFNKILAAAAHRMPCTSGSHIYDPRRESKALAAKPPLLTLDAQGQITDLLVAEHNCMPKTYLRGKSPLEVRRAAVARGLCIRHTVPEFRNPFSMYRFRDKCTLRARAQQFGGALHINYCYLPYRWVGKRPECVQAGMSAFIEGDRRDIRFLDVLDLNGVLLGQVACPKSWRRWPHSIAIRTLNLPLTNPLSAIASNWHGASLT